MDENKKNSKNYKIALQLKLQYQSIYFISTILLKVNIVYKMFLL